MCFLVKGDGDNGYDIVVTFKHIHGYWEYKEQAFYYNFSGYRAENAIVNGTFIRKIKNSPVKYRFLDINRYIIFPLHGHVLTGNTSLLNGEWLFNYYVS